jgi:GNAT superfamily N-acetyltransferase
MPECVMRRATLAHVPAIVAMLSDDALGASRESLGDPAPYEAAFRRIDADPNQLLAVAEQGGAVVGTLQLTFIAGLSRKGMTRALIEAVRVHRDARSGGLGTRMIEWAVDEARARGCGIVQLTTDRTRTDAHRFYERLGFEPSHIGYKKAL